MKNYDAPATAGCSGPLKGCVIISVLVAVVLIGTLIYAVRLPAVRAAMDCRSNMTAVGEALNRYASVNGHYPESLRDLENEYLTDSSVLRCKSVDSKQEVDFTYHRPGADANDRFVMLEIDMRRLGRDLPDRRMIMRKNETIELVR